MFKYRNAIYRRAIVPAPHYHKRQQRRDRALQEDRIPTFEETWAAMQDSEMEPFEEDRERVEKELYPEAVQLVERELRTGMDCWRAMKIPVKINAATLQQLGIYWAYEKDSAELYDDYWPSYRYEPLQHVIYRGRIDMRYVDKWGTVVTAANPMYGDEEEVRFHVGVPIWVYDVEVIHTEVNPKTHEVIERTVEDTIKINGWRTT